MSFKNEDQRIPNSDSGKFDAVVKTTKISYTRDFLFSLSSLEACKKLPTGFDEPLLSELGEGSESGLDRPRIPSSFPLQGIKRTLSSSSPPTQGDSSDNSRGSLGKWESWRSGRDSDSQSDRDSDSVRSYGHQSRGSWHTREQDGLLGSGSVARPFGYTSGMSAPKMRLNEQYQHNKSTEPYHPPRPYKMLSPEDHLKADIQLDSFINARGDFGLLIAKRSRTKRTPIDWWQRFGDSTPELTKFAIRVLGLTCSASGCERNWSTFESIHTKRRNRLEHAKLNALVFVKYNLKLRERSIRMRDKIDPIIVEEINSDDEWIAEEEDPVLPLTTNWLDDDELFESDPIVRVPPEPYQSIFEFNREAVEDVDEDVDASPMTSKKRVCDIPSGSKSKHSRLSLVDEEENDLDAREDEETPTCGMFSFLNSIDEYSEMNDFE